TSTDQSPLLHVGGRRCTAASFTQHKPYVSILLLPNTSGAASSAILPNVLRSVFLSPAMPLRQGIWHGPSFLGAHFSYRQIVNSDQDGAMDNSWRPWREPPGNRARRPIGQFISALQILRVNLGTATTLGLALAFEAAEDGTRPLHREHRILHLTLCLHKEEGLATCMSWRLRSLLVQSQVQLLPIQLMHLIVERPIDFPI
ncbi:hypothetical protein, partial [Paracoccus sp. (in: a-proteobacteria)]|uniref:hypothetical protein n=1 Tax=Paracoccus sp. TaxID=267 RepID=UPI00396C8AA9